MSSVQDSLEVLPKEKDRIGRHLNVAAPGGIALKTKFKESTMFGRILSKVTITWTSKKRKSKRREDRLKRKTTSTDTLMLLLPRGNCILSKVTAGTTSTQTLTITITTSTQTLTITFTMGTRILCTQTITFTIGHNIVCGLHEQQHCVWTP